MLFKFGRARRYVAGVGCFFLISPNVAIAQAEPGPDIVVREWLEPKKDNDRIKELERRIKELNDRADRAEAELRREAERRQAESRRHSEAAAEAERRREEERQRQRQADEARQRAADAQHALEQERQRELRSRRYAATAVGRNPANKSLFATTLVNQASMGEAESNALAQCNQRASDCRIAARFSGAGRCVFAAAGRTIMRDGPRVGYRYGIRVAPSESEALAKCRSTFERCNVFHTRCNGSG